MCVPWQLLCARQSVLDNAERTETATRQVWLRLTDVYDGDTFTAAFVDADGKIRRKRCRCFGYDAPEMKGDHKEDALKARDRLRELLSARMFRTTVRGLDKYGRFLVDIKVRGEMLSDIMIREDHGYAYSGGTKQK